MITRWPDSIVFDLDGNDHRIRCLELSTRYARHLQSLNGRFVMVKYASRLGRPFQPFFCNGRECPKG